MSFTHWLCTSVEDWTGLGYCGFGCSEDLGQAQENQKCSGPTGRDGGCGVEVVGQDQKCGDRARGLAQEDRCPAGEATEILAAEPEYQEEQRPQCCPCEPDDPEDGVVA